LGVSGNGNYLAGGSGNDFLAATGSTNPLDPHGAGTDILFAAPNAHDHDIFVYHPGYGNVTINNFTPQIGDIINFAGFGISNVQQLAPYVSTSADGSIVLALRRILPPDARRHPWWAAEQLVQFQRVNRFARLARLANNDDDSARMLVIAMTEALPPRSQ
jgi:hypothetical protein